MSNRIHLMCLAAFSALVAVSGVARADGAVVTIDLRTEERAAQPMTCAQATQFAWFKRQMELSDRTFDSAIPVPAECQRQIVATDDATFEAVQATTGESE